MVIRKQAQQFACAIAIAVAVVSPHARAEATSFTFGGSADDVIAAVAVDAARNTYIAGYTYSADLPGTARAFQKERHGGGDAFVAKFDDGGRLQWSTYLGGRDPVLEYQTGYIPDIAYAIAVDPQGNVYVAGSTAASDFPTANAYQAARRSTGYGTDGFLAKLDPTGSRLIYSTYLGGAGGGSTTVRSLAVGVAGEVWVGIDSTAPQFPTTNPSPDLSRGGSSGTMVAKFQSSGMPLWITPVAGYDGSRGSDLAIDAFGQPNVVANGQLIQLDASGRRENFRWSAPGATATNVTAGFMGSLIVSGRATADLATRNAWQPEFDPAGSGFIAILNARGVPDLITYVPGGIGGSLGLDGAGNIHAAFNFNPVTKAPDGLRVPEHPDGPIFTTIDRGDRWTWASRGLYGFVKTVAFDPIRDFMYASGEVGVFRSTDRGASWSLWAARVDDTSSGPLGSSLIALDPRDPTTMYGGNRNLYRLDQDGRVKTLLRRATAGVGGFRVESVAVSPHDGAVWLGTGSGLEVSFDRGATWSKRDSGFPTSQGFTVSPYLIFFDNQQPGRVFVRLRTGNLQLTADNGLTWQSASLPANPTGLSTRPDFAVDPVDTEHFYLGSNLGGFLTSPDGGRRWTSTFIYPASVSALAVSPVPPYQVYAAYRPGFLSAGEAIIFSGDRGGSWFAARHAIQRRRPDSIIAHPTDRDRAFSLADTTAASYVMRMTLTTTAPTYASAFSSVLSQGTIGALAASIDGETLLGLNTSSSTNRGDVTVLRIR